MSNDESAWAWAVPGVGLRPLLLDAAQAHRSGAIRYREDATAILRHDSTGELEIAPSAQIPCIRATFDDLNKSLSRLANSPLLPGGKTLRELYDEAYAEYEALCAETMASGGVEPDYGTYVFDPRDRFLYLVAPVQWHRLGLITSNSKLIQDPEGKLSWAEIRARLEHAVIGFAGASVGGNVLEGWLREARPSRVKIADPDWVELTNFNRGERMSLRHLALSRAARFDPRNSYDVPRMSKAAYIAYEASLVDPYMEAFVYEEGLTDENVERFLLGDGGDEPRLDVLVEETDDIDLKISLREAARRHGIDVLMLSDFGHRAHVLWNPFRTDASAAIGHGASDEELAAAVANVKKNGRSHFPRVVTALCGHDSLGPEFDDWFAGVTEQPTGSLPQSGATAMASGAIGGKELALHVLGHSLPPGNRVIYDLGHRTSTLG
ncbi:nitroreductase family protein [Paraliomyxa miuraensis]|uniref:hypothetical protein n=1 Tax=Paraliomyxa miuraensis TaxID=376150 RepID=UPI00224EBCCA|nr:hypothetical protein [Paraliomyxa miuraensis]MCX4240266.1 hypothetical protein [Paraliomyxa miuraensis]